MYKMLDYIHTFTFFSEALHCFWSCVHVNLAHFITFQDFPFPLEGTCTPSSLLMFLPVLCLSVWNSRLYICAEYIQYPTRRSANVLCILTSCECCQGVWCHNPGYKT